MARPAELIAKRLQPFSEPRHHAEDEEAQAAERSGEDHVAIGDGDPDGARGPDCHTDCPWLECDNHS